jgi:hypothetical protein
MKCFQCDAQAVAVCNRCFIGQCEKHLAEDQRRRATNIGYYLSGCTHQVPRVERAE